MFTTGDFSSVTFARGSRGRVSGLSNCWLTGRTCGTACARVEHLVLCPQFLLLVDFECVPSASLQHGWLGRRMHEHPSCIREHHSPHLLLQCHVSDGVTTSDRLSWISKECRYTACPRRTARMRTLTELASTKEFIRTHCIPCDHRQGHLSTRW